MVPCHQEGVSIAGIYYAHGLKCARYPAQFIVFVGVVIILCSLPFFITTSGDVNSPKVWRSPWLNYRLSSTEEEGSVKRETKGPSGLASDWIITDPSKMSVRTPLWFLGLPPVVMQQVYTNVRVDCSGSLADLCQSTQYTLSKKTTAMMIDSLLKAEKLCGPVMHPAVSKFARLHSNIDTPLSSFISSILSPLLDNLLQEENKPATLKALEANMSLPTIKELFYGGFWEQSHTQWSDRNKKNYKEFQFALTLALQPTKTNFQLVTECVETLKNIWPLENEEEEQLSFMKHIYYESEWTIYTFAPLICLYSIVFLYISFSVGKIDLVRSKIGLGFTSVITVICSLTMSLGICTFFGLSITVSGSEIFPFVVVVIGLENILIITKAVISTDPGLDVKFRIAEGLGREGRALTKNLMTILVLVILGIFTFNYAMKEFCIIALVGLLCDYFLHIVFFTTVLSIDLRRMELTDLQLSYHANKSSQTVESLERTWRRIPKRERVNNFLVRNRFAQKFLIVVLLIYLMSVLSHTEQFHSFVSSVVTPTTHDTTPPEAVSIPAPIPNEKTDTSSNAIPSLVQVASKMKEYVDDLIGSSIQGKFVTFRSDEDGFGTLCGKDSTCWRPMVTTHWPHLLNFYNITLEKKFITVLPPIVLNHRLGFSPQKLFAKNSRSKDLLVALSDILMTLLSIPNVIRGFFLLVISGIVLAYLIVLSHEASHNHKKEELKERESQKLTTIYTLRGHVQDIECLSIDDGIIVTASLDGMVYVWDLGQRQCSTAIDRRELRLRDYQDTISRHVEGCEAPDIKSNSPPTPTSTAAHTSNANAIQPAKPLLPPSPLPSHQPTSLPSPLDSSPNPTSSSTPTTIFPVHIPQKIIPGFLKRLSMPTILKRSPEKPEKQLSEGELSGMATAISETSSLHPSDSISVSSHLVPQLHAPLGTSRSLRREFCGSGRSVQTNSSGSSSHGSLNSTTAVTTYSRPLVSHQEMSNGSRQSLRSLSNDSSSNNGAKQVALPETENTSWSNWSAESLSLVSDNTSDLSYETPEMGPTPSPPEPKNHGFQFRQHFSFYSQFTADLALMHCPTSIDELWESYAASPVWCLDVLNGTIVVGCGNGQIEAWSIPSGSLKFCLSHDIPGVTVIKAHPIGIISGHLDGSLQLTGNHGRLMHGILAHCKPVTALEYYGDCVISGGSDAIVKVYRISDFICLHSLTVHSGIITTLTLVESEFCLSGCSAGTVCLWRFKTGFIAHKLECKGSEEPDQRGDYSRGIVKACCNSSHIVALLRDSSVQIWDRGNGYLSNIIEMGMYAHDLTLLSSKHFAIALQSQIVIYDIAGRHEVTRKELENTIGMPVVRHLTSLEASTLICTTGREVQLIPTGLKMKTE